MSAPNTFTLEIDTESTQADEQHHQHQSLRQCVEHALNNYFSHLDDQYTTDLYQMVLQEVEAPLLETVMHKTRNNQSKAAETLGLNRGTLRKKLKQYNLL